MNDQINICGDCDIESHDTHGQGDGCGCKNEAHFQYDQDLYYERLDSETYGEEA